MQAVQKEGPESEGRESLVQQFVTYDGQVLVEQEVHKRAGGCKAKKRLPEIKGGKELLLESLGVDKLQEGHHYSLQAGMHAAL